MKVTLASGLNGAGWLGADGLHLPVGQSAWCAPAGAQAAAELAPTPDLGMPESGGWCFGLSKLAGAAWRSSVR